MTRIVYTFLIAIILTSCILAQNIYDDAEHSGDYESELAVTQITFKENKKQPTSPVRATVAPRKTKATTTAAKASTTTRPPQKKTDLQSDLNDFLELIPTDDIKEKFDEYYRNDMDIQHIYEYLSSKEFYELRKYVLDMQDVKEVLQYLHRKGFNVKLLVRKVGHRLGFNKMKLQRQTSHEAGNLGKWMLNEECLAESDEFIWFFRRYEHNHRRIERAGWRYLGCSTARRNIRPFLWETWQKHRFQYIRWVNRKSGVCSQIQCSMGESIKFDHFYCVCYHYCFHFRVRRNCTRSQPNWKNIKSMWVKLSKFFGIISFLELYK